MRRLQPDGAQAMLDDADLPGVGNVFERIADDVRTEAGDDGERARRAPRLRRLSGTSGAGVGDQVLTSGSPS